MKDFNRKNFIIVFDEHDNIHIIPKKDVASVEEIAEDARIFSRISFKPDASSAVRAPLSSNRPAEEIVRDLNGNPDDAQIRVWEKSIMEERRQHAQDRLELLRRTHDQEMSRSVHDHQENVKTATREQETVTQSVRSIVKEIDASWRLRMANRLFSHAQGDNLVSQTAGILGRCLATNKVHLFEKGADQETRAAQLKADMERSIKERERADRQKESEFQRIKENLEKQRSDPQMRDEDRHILNQKIQDYRVMHSEPDFRFIRSHGSEKSYKLEADVARERSEAWERRHENSQSRGRGLTRSRSYTRGPEMDYER